MSKNSLMSALVLLVVALIGAVIWQRSEDSIAHESSFQSSPMRSVYRYSKMTPNFGPEFAYRISLSVPPGFSAQSRQLVGYLSLRSSSVMKPLKVYGYIRNSNIRKYGYPTSLYRLYGNTIGLVRKSKVDGYVPFVELSKLVPSKAFRKFAYATDIETVNALKSWGYGSVRLIGFIKAPPKKPQTPSSKPTVKPQSLKNLVRYGRNLSRFGWAFTYRTVGTSVAGYPYRKVIGYLFTQPRQGLRALNVWARSSASSIRKFGMKTTSYPSYIGRAGYCRIGAAVGFTPLTQVRKYSPVYRRTFYGYAHNDASLAAFKRAGYVSPVRLCYIKISK